MTQEPPTGTEHDTFLERVRQANPGLFDDSKTVLVELPTIPRPPPRWHRWYKYAIGYYNWLFAENAAEAKAITALHDIRAVCALTHDGVPRAHAALSEIDQIARRGLEP